MAMIASKAPLALPTGAADSVAVLLRSVVEDERRSVALVSLGSRAPWSWEAE